MEKRNKIGAAWMGYGWSFSCEIIQMCNFANPNYSGHKRNNPSLSQNFIILNVLKKSML